MTKSIKALSQKHSAGTGLQMLQAAMKHVPEAAQEPQVVTAKGPWARTWALQALWAWASFELQAAGELQTHFCGPVAIINWYS